MAQIAFLTLFLGLTLGPQPIELTVTGPVAAVELLLDGAPAGRLTGPPWKGQIDFGTSLVPHQLVARALDTRVPRSRAHEQWLNLPRPPAEVDSPPRERCRGPARGGAAHLAEPDRRETHRHRRHVRRPAARSGCGRHVQLPAWNPETGHVLTAELRFSGALTARRDVVFGGPGRRDLERADRGAGPSAPGRAAAPDRMQGWFRARRPAADRGRGGRRPRRAPGGE